MQSPAAARRYHPGPEADHTGAGGRRVARSLLQRPGRRSFDLRGRVRQRGRGHGVRIRRHRLADAGGGGYGDGDGDGERPRRAERHPGDGGDDRRLAGTAERPRGARGTLRRDRRRELDGQHELEDAGAAGRMARGNDRPRRPGHETGAAGQRVDGANPRRPGKPGSSAGAGPGGPVGPRVTAGVLQRADGADSAHVGATGEPEDTESRQEPRFDGPYPRRAGKLGEPQDVERLRERPDRRDPARVGQPGEPRVSASRPQRFDGPDPGRDGHLGEPGDAGPRRGTT